MTGAVNAVSIEHKGQPGLIKAKAVILAAGGFEANPTHALAVSGSRLGSGICARYTV